MTNKEIKNALGNTIASLKNVYRLTRRFEAVKFRALDSDGSIKQLNKDMAQLLEIGYYSAALAGEELDFKGLDNGHLLKKFAVAWKDTVKLTDVFLCIIDIEYGVDCGRLSDCCKNYYQQIVNVTEEANNGREGYLGATISGETRVLRLNLHNFIQQLKLMRKSKVAIDACIKYIGQLS